MMKLIIISSPEYFPQEASLINELFDAGMQFFHLRKPNSNAKNLDELLQKINPENYSKIALHQHQFLAGKNSINRLHFTETDRKNTATDSLKILNRKGFMLSTSVHQPSEILNQAHFDYVFLSPVFNSISKPGYSGFANASFTLQKSADPPEVIALGGINAANIGQLKTMNFDGAAVLGSIWQTPETAVFNFRSLQQKCLELNTIPLKP